MQQPTEKPLKVYPRIYLDSVYDLRTVFRAAVLCGMEHVTWEVLKYIDSVSICTSQLSPYKS